MVTPNRPDAICLMALHSLSPLSCFEKRASSSPPSPELDFPPIRFMATARVLWASCEMEPKLMAPVAKRVKMESTCSTSSRGIEGRCLKERRWRKERPF